MENETRDRFRIDKWLWAARFFKTRSLAADAVDGGKVYVNGARVKPARAVRVGDELRIRQGPHELTVIVRALSDRRGPAAQAQQLYEETRESRQARELLAEQLRLQSVPRFDRKGRPTKKARRQIARFTGGRF
jgi:ribosome-associated heat shock protein Hsp15